MNSLRLVTSEATVYVLTVQASGQSTGHRVEVIYDGKNFTGTCDCVGPQLSTVCSHLLGVFSNKAPLQHREDLKKMRIINAGVRGTNLVKKIERMWEAELELKQAQEKVHHMNRLLAYDLIPADRI